MNFHFSYRHAVVFAIPLAFAGILGMRLANAQQPTFRKGPFAFTTGDFRINASRYLDDERGTVVDGAVTVTTLHSGLHLVIASGGHELRIQQEEPIRLAVMPFDTASQTTEFRDGVTIFRDKTGRSLTIKPYGSK